MRKWLTIVFGLLLVTQLGCAAAQPVAEPLDWAAPARWVHIDTVGERDVERFEGARRQWLATLAAAGPAWLPDGRPLFWSSRGATERTYLTLYPYATWSDLAARTAATARTEQRVGAAAVAAYDSGDQVLVSPHRSELWRRLPELDLEPDSGAVPDERQAAQALLERRRMPWGLEQEELYELWPRLRAALRELGYRPTCRASWSAVGDGSLVLLCLSAGADVPSIGEALAAGAGTSDLALALEALAPVTDRRALDRRDDLSHLPPRGGR